MTNGTGVFEATKLTPPALDAVLVRERLFEQLGGTGAAARWVTAPSGAGKSTLVASFAARAARPLLWYRVDERDEDPAFFFRAWLTALAFSLANAALLRVRIRCEEEALATHCDYARRLGDRPRLIPARRATA